jgi:hypothetical protein
MICPKKYMVILTPPFDIGDVVYYYSEVTKLCRAYMVINIENPEYADAVRVDMGIDEIDPYPMGMTGEGYPIYQHNDAENFHTHSDKKVIL